LRAQQRLAPGGAAPLTRTTFASLGLQGPLIKLVFLI
jgi:hypothetical protein